VGLDGNYIAAGALILIAAPNPTRVAVETEKLKTAKLRAGSLSMAEYELTPMEGAAPRNESWVVYAGPYATAPEALRDCTQVADLSFQKRCRVYRVQKR
jgi:hypothetical protein